MRTLVLINCGLILAAPLTAQDQITDRVRDRLAPELAERIITLMESARVRSLPAAAVADVALLGASRGADAEAIVESAQETLRALDLSLSALGANEDAPTDAEIAAGAQAIRAGVDPEQLRSLAMDAGRSQPLVVAASVLAGIAAAGVPVSSATAIMAGRDLPGSPIAGLPIGGLILPLGPPASVPINVGAPGDRPGRPVGPPIDRPRR